MNTYYERAKNYRADFLKNHKPNERQLVSIRRPGIRIELYRIDPGEMIPMETVLVLVDDADRKEPVPFLHNSRVEKYRKCGSAFLMFKECCKRYGIKGVDLDRAIKRIKAMDLC